MLLLVKGLFRCYEGGTGEIIWEEKLDGLYYSSPVLVDGMIYLFNRKGKGFVFKAGREFEVLAENELPYGVFATPVICEDLMYLRTLKTFYCFGK